MSGSLWRITDTPRSLDKFIEKLRYKIKTHKLDKKSWHDIKFIQCGCYTPGNYHRNEPYTPQCIIKLNFWSINIENRVYGVVSTI